MRTGETFYGDGYVRSITKLTGYLAIGEVIIVASPLLLNHFFINQLSTIGFITLIGYVCWSIHDIVESFNRADAGEEYINEYYKGKAESYLESPRGYRVLRVLKATLVIGIRLILLAETAQILFVNG